MASLQEAVVKGLAADRGLFMPMTIKPLPQEFYDTIDTLSFQEIAYRVADAFFGGLCNDRRCTCTCATAHSGSDEYQHQSFIGSQRSGMRHQ